MQAVAATAALDAAAQGSAHFACVQHAAAQAMRVPVVHNASLLAAAAAAPPRDARLRAYLRRAAAAPTSAALARPHFELLVRALLRHRAMAPAIRLVEHAARQGVSVKSQAADAQGAAAPS